MAKKLTKIERLMDFGDIPPARKIYPEQEKRLNDARPAWLKAIIGSKP